MILQLPTPEIIKISAPISIAIKDVSPNDPGIKPNNASLKLHWSSLQGVMFAANAPSIVSPEYPSILAPCTHTLSPDI